MTTEFLICNERKKLSFVAFFSRHFRGLLFDYFPIVWWDLSLVIRYYSPSLFFNCGSRTPGTKFLSSNHNNTERHQPKKSLENGNKYAK
jgi:hypothetical protein